MGKRLDPGALERALSAQALNAGCFCVEIDRDALQSALAGQFGSPDLFALVRERCPHLFAAQAVFVSPDHLERMAAIARAVESVAALPAYRELVLARAPAIARHDPGAKGAFFGYDFHVANGRVGLIEINTNAGGAMVNTVLAHAHRGCCAAVAQFGPTVDRADEFEQAIVAMFRREWQLAGRSGEPRTVAIVDESPAEQYLYPEFLLFQRLFERHGMRAVIAAPEQLEYRGGRLWVGEEPVDLVYNRLTDFYFDAPASAAIRSAYLEGAAVVTPHPRAHALFADKRNLVLLTDPEALASIGVGAQEREVLLQGIPRTIEVDESNAQDLWPARREWFFKPSGGYGSKAAYRGEKLTQRVWQEILRGGYVAQHVVAPGERALPADGDRPLKYDLRNYVYEGGVQWVAARLYQGQTTNFRTPGGGFAPVCRALA